MLSVPTAAVLPKNTHAMVSEVDLVILTPSDAPLRPEVIAGVARQTGVKINIHRITARPGPRMSIDGRRSLADEMRHDESVRRRGWWFWTTTSSWATTA